MSNFKFIERKIIEKEINIEAENEIEAIDFFLKIKTNSDILDMDNNAVKSESFEIEIESDIDDDNEDELEAEYDEEE